MEKITVRNTEARQTFLEIGLRVLVGSFVLSLSSQITIPIGPVPITLQTLAIQGIAWYLGPVQGSMAAALYLFEGACGLPVFSAFGSGLMRIFGPTGGYLWGFVPAVACVGWLYERIRSRGVTGLSVFLTGLVGWIVVTVGGWVQLSVLVGWHSAWVLGVLPFFPVEIIKSLTWTLIVRSKKFASK